MDTAYETSRNRAPEPLAPVLLAPAKPRKQATANPAMNRQERVIFAAYLAMIVMIVAFLAVTGLAAWLGA